MKAFTTDTLHQVKQWADRLEKCEIAVREAESKYNCCRYFFMAKPDTANLCHLQRSLERLNIEREQLEKTRCNFEHEVFNAEMMGV